jgi:hypothetical protein
MDESNLEFWVEESREKAYSYLESQGIRNPNVGEWPAFEVAPYFAIWAIESQASPGKIGWWAFTGDCPSDYVSEDGSCHPRSALQTLISNWENYVSYLKRGTQPPETSFGSHSDPKELANLLVERISLLKGWGNDDKLWEER